MGARGGGGGGAPVSTPRTSRALSSQRLHARLGARRGGLPKGATDSVAVYALAPCSAALPWGTRGGAREAGACGALRCWPFGACRQHLPASSRVLVPLKMRGRQCSGGGWWRVGVCGVCGGVEVTRSAPRPRMAAPRRVNRHRRGAGLVLRPERRRRKKQVFFGNRVPAPLPPKSSFWLETPASAVALLARRARSSSATPRAAPQTAQPPKSAPEKGKRVPRVRKSKAGDGAAPSQNARLPAGRRRRARSLLTE